MSDIFGYVRISQVRRKSRLLQLAGVVCAPATRAPHTRVVSPHCQFVPHCYTTRYMLPETREYELTLKPYYVL